jgi:hypothetical protein
MCGHRNPPGSSFCSACGSSLDHTGEHTVAMGRLDHELPREEPADVGAVDIAAGSAMLVVRGGDQSGLRFALLDRVTSLGRSVENDISLDDITVSRRHAVIERVGDQFTVHDNGSLNGTYVNHERITSARLEHGDELQVGKFHFLFLLGAE